MNMNQVKIDEQIKKNLFSAKTEIVISAIEAIQKKGKQTLYSDSFRFVKFFSPEREIESEIINLLGTVKDKETLTALCAPLKMTNIKESEN
jgi:hypothetical protein